MSITAKFTHDITPMTYSFTAYNKVTLTIYSPALDSNLYCVFRDGRLMGKIFYDDKVIPSAWKTNYDNLKPMVKSIGILIDESRTKNAPQPFQQ